MDVLRATVAFPVSSHGTAGQIDFFEDHAIFR